MAEYVLRYRVMERSGDGTITDVPSANGVERWFLRNPHASLDEAANAILKDARYPGSCFIVTEVVPNE